MWFWIIVLNSLRIVFYFKLYRLHFVWMLNSEKLYLCVLSMKLMEVLFLSLQELGGQVWNNAIYIILVIFTRPATKACENVELILGYFGLL
jgi:hypothetical protein